MTKRNTILFMVLIFTISVLIRIPNLNRPLSKHHEFLTAISLRVLQIWKQEGATELHFLPRMNYKGASNKNINNHASTTGNMKDKEGNYYYVSHPPFAFMLAYSFHAALNLKVSVLSLQIFNILINLLSALFIFLLLSELFKNNLIALSGTIIYLFDPAVLWFQSNTYMSDILVHFFFICTIYFLIRSTNEGMKWNKLNTILTYTSLFLMCSSSWLGYFFGGVMALYFLYKARTDRSHLLHLLLVVLICSLSLFLTVIHYSEIAGAELYLEQMKNRFAERGLPTKSRLTEGLFELLKKYAIIILNILVNHGILISLLLYGLFKNRKNVFTSMTNIPHYVMVISLGPVLLLNLLLPDYCGHDFTTLYISVALTLVIISLFEKVLLHSNKNRIILLLSTYLLISTLWYYGENLPGENSIKGKPYSVAMNLGKFIKDRSKIDLPVILISNEILGPETVFYAERNIFEARDKEEVLHFLQVNHYTAGNLITIDKENKPMHFILKKY